MHSVFAVYSFSFERGYTRVLIFSLCLVIVCCLNIMTYNFNSLWLLSFLKILSDLLYKYKRIYSRVKTVYYKVVILHSLHIKIMSVHNLHLKPGMIREEDLILHMKIKSNGHFS